MNEQVSLFRFATAELIGFGIVGTMLDGAYDVLVDIDATMASDLKVVMDRVMVRFNAAETIIFNTKEISG
jgi:hypothetical protein